MRDWANVLFLPRIISLLEYLFHTVSYLGFNFGILKPELKSEIHRVNPQRPVSVGAREHRGAPHSCRLSLITALHQLSCHFKSSCTTAAALRETLLSGKMAKNGYRKAEKEEKPRTWREMQPGQNAKGSSTFQRHHTLRCRGQHLT